MTLTIPARKTLTTAAFVLALAVLIGAFGAHGLKNIVAADKLVTFETGVRYHFYHGLALMMVGILQLQLPELHLKGAALSFLIGILLFSFNCYFYVLSDLKIFAMLVPVGGLLFITGWLIFAWKVLKFS